MSTGEPESSQSSDVSRLDELIDLYCEEIKQNVKGNAKVGDLLKMVELKHKLAPADADQKKFWSMLDQIRRETLGKKAQPVKKSRAKKE